MCFPFQSTLPVRGATEKLENGEADYYISIHAPREGSDEKPLNARITQPTKFQSTLPVRGATEKSETIRDTLIISIHAPREGSDHRHSRHVVYSRGFQSTLPVRGATLYRKQGTPFRGISIHAPREGSDPLGYVAPVFQDNFNPRSP